MAILSIAGSYKPQLRKEKKQQQQQQKKTQKKSKRRKTHFNLTRIRY